MSNKFFLDKKSNIVFVKTTDGYVPFAVDYDQETGQCRIISQDPILMELYEFVMFFQRRRTNNGTYVSAPVFPYQWSFIFRHAMSLLKREGDTFVESYARQSGKSFSIQLLCAWELVFLPRYINVKLERYSMIVCSYKEKSIEKLFSDCKRAIYKAVEWHNKKYKDKLITKSGEFSNPKLIDSSTIIEINKQFTDGDEVPYSKCTSITLGTVNDG